MPVFGSFSLLLALALSAYTLLAGALALRQLAVRGRTRIPPERLCAADYYSRFAGMPPTYGLSVFWRY